MEAIQFIPGPQIAGTTVIDSSGVQWEVLKNIGNALAQPREGSYYTRVVTPIAVVPSYDAKSEIERVRLEMQEIIKRLMKLETTGLVVQKPTLIYPPDVNFTVVVPLPMGLPEYRVPVEEKSYGVLPDNKVLRYTRITDEIAFNKSNPRHHYSKTQPWNCDETKALVSGHLLTVEDNYKIIRTVSNLGTNFEWSKTDNDKVYAVNNIAFFVIKPSTNEVLFKRDFKLEGWTRMNKGNDEGTMDNLDRYVPMIGTNATGQHCGVYDIKANVLYMKPFEFYLPGGGTVDGCAITQGGSGLLVNVAGSDPTAGGLRAALYDVSNLTLIRNIVLSTASHADWGYHQDGGEIYAHHNGIGFRRIETGVFKSTITNWNAQFNNNLPMAGHANCRNYKRPGWMYNSNTRHDSFRELYGLKLDNGIDATCVVNRFGFARIAVPLPTGVNTYDVEPKGVVSPSGTKMMWNTLWPNQDKVYAFVSDVIQKN